MAVLGGIGFLVVIVAAYVGGNWLLSRLRRPQSLSEELEQRYSERLLSPRWEELEGYFNRSIPEQIKRFYGHAEILSRHDVRVTIANGATYHITRFLPADIETLNGIWPDVKTSANFPLATDAFGDCYYIPLTGDKSEQCPVMCYHHDGGDFKSVCTSLDEFLNGIEKPGPDWSRAFNRSMQHHLI
jgi:hypothetical protein